MHSAYYAQSNAVVVAVAVAVVVVIIVIIHQFNLL